MENFIGQIPSQQKKNQSLIYHCSIIPHFLYQRQGFPNGVDWWGGQFGQNGQKMHENDKIGIFGSKQFGGGHGGTSQFFG